MTEQGKERCEYCNQSEDDLKLCQLSPNPRSKNAEWQAPKIICKSCRKYLRGVFRLSRISKQEFQESLR